MHDLQSSNESPWIEVQHDLRMGAAQLLGVLDGPLSHIAQQRLIGVLASAASTPAE